MIQSGHTAKTTPFLTTISEDAVNEIKQAAFLILEQTGCTIDHPGMLETLTKAGAVVKGTRVYLPRHLVQAAIKKAPRGFVMYDRNGKPAMDLTGTKSYFGTSTASPNQRHALEHDRQKTGLQDIEWGATVADALGNLDFVMPFGSALDVKEPGSGDLFEFETTVKYTTKPIFFCGYSANGFKYIIKMASAIAGSPELLARKPFICAYPEPISPLQFPKETVEKIAVCAEHKIPQVISGSQFLGFTSPVTTAGALALATAESFAGILLAQLIKPGTPCFLTCSPSGGNMRTGVSFMASPEMTLCLAAQAQIARSIGLPTWGLAGATDSKVLDAQAGAEAALSIVLQALAGVNVIHDVGYMDMGMTCSCAMMVLGDEIINWVKRFMKGIDVNAHTLATEIINAAGPGGHFLTQHHTIDYMRQEVWQPELFFKDSYDAWLREGSTSLEQRADEKVAHIIQNYKTNPLNSEILKTITEIRDKGAACILEQT
ncbi:MAG: trimethylamine methyltransferase family protein [Desulfobacterales bacterium]|nr:trimethylamine methyltransferase family protein [Desulfobacterales bacterium]